MREFEHLRVMLSVVGPSKKTNPFVLLLNESVSPEVRSSFFSWKRFLLLNFDVLHLHWPEELLRGRNAVVSLVKCFVIACYIPMLRVRRKPVLWTVHNPDPHEGLSGFQGIVYRALVRTVSYRVYLSGTMRPVSSTASDSAVIPHGHYKATVAPRRDIRASAAYDFIYFGRIKPYKGIPTLLDVFDEDRTFQHSLRISGNADPGELKDRILRACTVDNRITSNLAYLDEVDLHSEIRDSKMVVLPYEEMFNSGALLLALSLDRPVVAPRTPTTEELADEVGSHWVFLYDGELTSQVLSQSLRKCPPPGSSPDLSRRDWKRLGEDYRLAYQQILVKR